MPGNILGNGKVPWNRKGVALFNRQARADGPRLSYLMPPALDSAMDADTELLKTLVRDLDAVKDIIGQARYNEVVRHLNYSNEHASTSYLEAATAYTVLWAPNINDDQTSKELLKAAKKSLRNVIIWRACGSVLGLDSRPAMLNCFERACSHACCDKDAISQLTNGYQHILAELANLSSQTAAQETHCKAAQQASSSSEPFTSVLHRPGRIAPDSVQGPLSPGQLEPHTPQERVLMATIVALEKELESMTSLNQHLVVQLNALELISGD